MELIKEESNPGIFIWRDTSVSWTTDSEEVAWRIIKLHYSEGKEGWMQLQRFTYHAAAGEPECGHVDILEGTERTGGRIAWRAAVDIDEDYSKGTVSATFNDREKAEAFLMGVLAGKFGSQFPDDLELVPVEPV